MQWGQCASHVVALDVTYLSAHVRSSGLTLQLFSHCKASVLSAYFYVKCPLPLTLAALFLIDLVTVSSKNVVLATSISSLAFSIRIELRETGGHPSASSVKPCTAVSELLMKRLVWGRAVPPRCSVAGEQRLLSP